MAYASKTEVPVERTRAELRRMLKNYGADQLFDAESSDPPAAVIGFRAHGLLVRISLPLPDPSDRQFTHTPTGRVRSKTQAEREYEQMLRQRWRALMLVTKAKFEAIEAGIEEFAVTFLPYIVLPDGSAVGERLLPQIAEAYETGGMPPLLAGGDRLLPPGS